MKRPFYKYLFLILAFIPFSATANESISAEIVGPKKIFTNDRITYSVTISGNDNAEAIIWNWKKDGITCGSNSKCEITASNSAGTIQLTCDVTVRIENSQTTIQASENISVSVPIINISRQSYRESDFIGTNIIKNIDILGSTGKALLHKNGMKLYQERFMISMIIGPSDTEIQQIELNVTPNNSLNFYSNLDSISPCELLDLDLTAYCGSMPISQIYDILPNYVEGIKCDDNIQIKLIVNHNEKISLDYGVFGYENTGIKYPTNNIKRKTAPGTNLVDNEWMYKPGSSVSQYNCLSYAIKQSGKINNTNFWVKDVLDGNPSYVYDNKFVANPNFPNCYLTSMDTFGNNNGIFDNNDVDSFFMNSYWGNDRAYGTTTSYSNCRKIYYNSSMFGPKFHAARKSNRTEGCHSNWHIFESKLGGKHIIIHRSEQLEGNYCGQIQQKYR